MHRVNRSVLVPYSCAQMFALVHDVERYPQFLPWCEASQVRHLEGGDTVEARIDMHYLGVRSHFTTRNVQRYPHAIEISLVDGPFRELRGLWSFRELRADACKVTVELEYSFAGGLLARAVAPVFERIANSLVEAFAARARALYGDVGD